MSDVPVVPFYLLSPASCPPWCEWCGDVLDGRGYTAPLYPYIICWDCTGGRVRAQYETGYEYSARMARMREAPADPAAQAARAPWPYIWRYPPPGPWWRSDRIYF